MKWLRPLSEDGNKPDARPGPQVMLYLCTDRTSPERLLALRQRTERSPLPQVRRDKLVDFRQTSPDHASLGTYIRNYLESDLETTHITWELHRREGQCRIHNITQAIWLTPYYTRGSDP